MASVRQFPTIKAIRSFIIDGVGSGGDYHNVKGGHWLVDSDISTPCSIWDQYKKSRTTWGINVLGSFLVEIEASDGTVGIATGFGGPPACWLVHKHFERFLIGADPRNTNLLFEQMYRASMFYGRKGLPTAIISVIDLAIWDLLGKLRNEPVYKLIGGAARERLDFYCTGPEPAAAKAMGFWGAKVPLPYCPADGHVGMKKNVEFLRRHRESVGPDFPLMVDCYMSLNVSYTIELARRCLDLDINWWEECLSPDDTDGFAQIKRAHPQLKFTTGEHEYSRFGFRKLVEGRNLDIIQPDVMWLGGLTELLKVSAMAAAYDIPVVPHASGSYSYHFVISQPNTPFQEYLANSPDGRSVLPVFGDLFLDEPIPTKGFLTTADLDKPGFGLTLNPAARSKLIPSDYLLNPAPMSGPKVEVTPEVPEAPVVAVEEDVKPTEAALETIPEVVPEVAPEVSPEVAPEVTPESEAPVVSVEEDAKPAEATPVTIPEAVAEAVPEATSEPTAADAAKEDAKPTETKPEESVPEATPEVSSIAIEETKPNEKTIPVNDITSGVEALVAA